MEERPLPAEVRGTTRPRRPSPVAPHRRGWRQKNLRREEGGNRPPAGWFRPPRLACRPEWSEGHLPRGKRRSKGRGGGGHGVTPHTARLCLILAPMGYDGLKHQGLQFHELRRKAATTGLHWAAWQRNGFTDCGNSVRCCPFNKDKGWLHDAARFFVKTRNRPESSLLSWPPTLTRWGFFVTFLIYVRSKRWPLFSFKSFL